MTGGKIIAVSKAADAVGKKALAEDEQHGVGQLNFDRGLVQSPDFGRQVPSCSYQMNVAQRCPP
jgi:hypothetical protein